MSTWDLAVPPALIAVAAAACDPIVVDAFEPVPEPVGMVPFTCPPGSIETEPGRCDCAIPDDFDGDGTADCLDACPDNANRIAPDGSCGCSSFPDTNACDQLRAAVRHLYTFDGEGTTIVDGQGDADGTLLHVTDPPPTPLDTLQRSGRITLDGQGSYVALPSGIISSLDDATFEAWMTWRGGDYWSRIFDFGDNDGATQADGVTYLFLTPTNAMTGTLRLAYSVAGPSEETRADGTIPMPTHVGPDDNTPDHVAVVIDRTNASLRLYSNGVEIASEDESLDLSAIRDVNNWLGRSNYFVDPPLSAVLVEFRIYTQALTAAQISASFQAGPGALD